MINAVKSVKSGKLILVGGMLALLWLLFSANPAFAVGDSQQTAYDKQPINSIGITENDRMKPPMSKPVSAYQILVNKTYMLDASYAPDDLVPLSAYVRSAAGIKMRKEAAEALGRMVDDLEKAGMRDIYANSAYRDYAKQKSLYTHKIATYTADGYQQEQAAALAGQWVAAPGTSEHQTGLAVDFSTATLKYGLNNNFATTAVGKWLKENSWRYGFVLRYPKDKTDVTGYAWESWHFRYVGAPHAEYITANALTLDEYQSKLREHGFLSYTAADGQLYTVYYSPYDSGNLFGSALTGISLARAGLGDYLLTTVQPPGALLDIVGHWGETYIRQLVETGVVMGYADHTFLPDANISKAELTTMLSRLLVLLENPAAVSYQVNEPFVFADCKETDYYYQAIWICYTAGLLDISLYQDNHDGTAVFFPGEIMRRKQVAMMLAGLFSLENANQDKNCFPDIGNLDHKVAVAINSLAERGILTGDARGNFNPENNITRAEICTIFSRILSDFQFAQGQAAQKSIAAE
ncbi:MAG: D-alanyl-D-alanine carboxypeptidase family protein [Clostridiales bacterium]